MTYEFVRFGSWEYFYFLTALLFARGMDLLSTWILMPTLVGEVNPVSKWLGWRGGIISSVVFSAAVAVWPMPAIVVSVLSLFVAARNFQGGWRMQSERPGVFVVCMASQSAIFGLVGGAVMAFTSVVSIPFAIGAGMVCFGVANFFFSMLSLWRNRGG